MDAELVPPNNASGGPAGLSNLTFCFIECKDDIYKDAYAIKNYSFYAKCYYELSLTGYTPSRLGWTNGSLWAQVGEFSFNLFAGGTDCTGYGTLVGTMTLDYNGSQAKVSISMISPYTLDAVHAYIGNDRLPLNSGQYIDDPNLFPIKYNLETATSHSFTVTGLSGEVYVIVHAIICGF